MIIFFPSCFSLLLRIPIICDMLNWNPRNWSTLRVTSSEQFLTRETRKLRNLNRIFIDFCFPWFQLQPAYLEHYGLSLNQNSHNKVIWKQIELRPPQHFVFRKSFLIVIMIMCKRRAFCVNKFIIELWYKLYYLRTILLCESKHPMKIYQDGECAFLIIILTCLNKEDISPWNLSQLDAAESNLNTSCPKATTGRSWLGNVEVTKMVNSWLRWLLCLLGSIVTCMTSWCRADV